MRSVSPPGSSVVLHVVRPDTRPGPARCTQARKPGTHSSQDPGNGQRSSGSAPSKERDVPCLEIRWESQGFKALEQPHRLQPVEGVAMRATVLAISSSTKMQAAMMAATMPAASHEVALPTCVHSRR